MNADGDLVLTRQTVQAWTTTKLFDDDTTTILLKGNAMYRFDTTSNRIKLATPEGLSVCDWPGSPSVCFKVVGRRIFFSKSVGDIGDDDGTAMGHSGVPGQVFRDHIVRQGIVLVYDVDADSWSRIPFEAAPATCQAGVAGLGSADSDRVNIDGNALAVVCAVSHQRHRDDAPLAGPEPSEPEVSDVGVAEDRGRDGRASVPGGGGSIGGDAAGVDEATPRRWAVAPLVAAESVAPARLGSG